MNKFIPRLIMFLTGLGIISISITLIIKVDLGAGAWDALNVGLSNKIGFTVGTWVFIVGIVLLFINAWLLKEKPQYIAILTLILNGTFIDFWLYIVFPNWVPDSILQRGVLLVIGTITLGLGIATYLQARFPPIPIDNLMIAIQKRTGLKMMMAKTIGEVSALILALIFSGPIGAGTLLLTFGIGPILQYFFPKLERLMDSLQKA